MTTPSGTSAASGTAASTTAAGRDSELETSLGSTTISETVVSKIAGLATAQIDGVAGFGGSTARAMGAVRERIPGARASTSQGVAVEVGERQAAVDLTIVVNYGVAIVELARAIRRNVISSIEQMTGLEVVEVNVSVVDLQLPGADTGEGQPAQTSRVE
jgi:uncharacterized alkaline shock family protein YloU